MQFNLRIIKENINIYIGILIYISIFSFFIWQEALLKLDILYKNIYQNKDFIAENSLKIIKINDKIHHDNLHELEKITGEFYQAIKNINYRINFSAILKLNNIDSEIRGLALDVKSENQNLQNGLSKINGSFEGFAVSQNVIKILGNNYNENYNLYLFNRDELEPKMSLFPIKISGSFETNEKILIIPLKIAETILKTDKYDYGVIEFHNKTVMLENMLKLNNALKDIGYKIEDDQNYLIKKEINIFSNLYLLILFAVAFLSLRDSVILNDKLKNIKFVLKLYGWSQTKIKILFLTQLLLVYIILITFGIVISIYIYLDLWYLLIPIFAINLFVSVMFFLLQSDKSNF